MWEVADGAGAGVGYTSPPAIQEGAAVPERTSMFKVDEIGVGALTVRVSEDIV